MKSESMKQPGSPASYIRNWSREIQTDQLERAFWWTSRSLKRLFNKTFDQPYRQNFVLSPSQLCRDG
ncbi:hypothetical protein QQF64_009405 [Cirrhinus molitorella]|uniref:Uncharacterized protein n=1 Tax=Cirrhinus molitorella TaxID=172907 RepID=A0ABR3M565_9TELE